MRCVVGTCIQKYWLVSSGVEVLEQHEALSSLYIILLAHDPVQAVVQKV